MALLAKSGSRETDCSSTTKSWAGHFNDFRSARIRAPSASISSKIQKTNLAPFWFERNFFEFSARRLTWAKGNRRMRWNCRWTTGRRRDCSSMTSSCCYRPPGGAGRRPTKTATLRREPTNRPFRPPVSASSGATWPWRSGTKPVEMKLKI